MTITRRAALLAMSATAAAPALAQTAPKSDPAAPIRALYAKPGAARSREPFTKRLQALQAAAIKRSRELDEPVSGLDFDYVVNGQDHEDGMARSVRIAVLSQSEARAEVKVTFRNGPLQELRYDMALEGGRWLVDDVRSLTKDQSWVLSELYREGAATPRS
jgi:hypothetical protein